MKLVMGEICRFDAAGEEGIAFDQAIIHFDGDTADSEREILIQSPGAPKIAEKLVDAVNSIDEVMRINNGLRDALLAIKALVCGDKHPRWSDDWATNGTRGRIADMIDTVVK